MERRRYNTRTCRVTKGQTRVISSSLWLAILNSFMIGTGAAAIVLAFTALNASTFGLNGLTAVMLAREWANTVDKDLIR